MAEQLDDGWTDATPQPQVDVHGTPNTRARRGTQPRSNSGPPASSSSARPTSLNLDTRSASDGTAPSEQVGIVRAMVIPPYTAATTLFYGIPETQPQQQPPSSQALPPLRGFEALDGFETQPPQPIWERPQPMDVNHERELSKRKIMAISGTNDGQYHWWVMNQRRKVQEVYDLVRQQASLEQAVQQLNPEQLLLLHTMAATMEIVCGQAVPDPQDPLRIEADNVPKRRRRTELQQLMTVMLQQADL